MAHLKGEDVLLFADSASIGGAKTCNIDITAETESVATKDECSGDWNDSEVKTKSWKMDTENLVPDKVKGKSFDDLFDLFDKGEPVDMVFSMGKDATDKALTEAPDAGWTVPTKGIYKGKALITSLSATGTKGDKASYKASFEGKGKLERVATV